MAPVYLHSKIKLKYGQLGAFNDAMADAKPIVEEHGWKLVGAWSTMIGDLNEVHDIWEIKDANAVGAVMRSAFGIPPSGPLRRSSQSRSKKRSSPS
jgi:NIPSNAP